MPACTCLRRICAPWKDIEKASSNAPANSRTTSDLQKMVLVSDLSRLCSFESLLADNTLELSTLLAHGDIIRLRSWLSTNTGLNKVRIGFSPGSKQLSFTARVAQLHEVNKMREEEVNLEKLEHFVRCMFGLLPEIDRPTVEEQSCQVELRSNCCLERFTGATGVGVVDIVRAVKPYGIQIKIRMCAAATLRDRLSGLVPFRFSRAYVQNDKPKLARSLVQSVWEGVACRRYVASEELKKSLTSVLQEYVSSGVDGMSERFMPQRVKPLGVYLLGTAGVGKSTFITVFARSFSAALKKYLTPTLNVDVVKIPLNSGSPAALTQCLRVKGISDWSVERVLEQSLVKGNICLLHLEELPPDAAVQTQMLDLVGATVDHLLGKYPERRGNVMYVVTSNYALSPKLQDEYTLIHVRPPGWDDQKAWAKAQLVDFLEETLQVPISVCIDDAVFPGHTEDMRPLNNWWLTLGYAIHSCCSREQVETASHKLETPIQCSVYMSDGAVFIAHQSSSADHVIVSEPFVSTDSFFYHRKGAAKLAEVFEMCHASLLKPAVVVSSDVEEIRTSLQHWGASRNAHICETEIQLRSQEDRSKIFGKFVCRF